MSLVQNPILTKSQKVIFILIKHKGRTQYSLMRYFSCDVTYEALTYHQKFNKYVCYGQTNLNDKKFS